MSVKKLFELSGRAAIVTGGSRGLGLQIAEALGEMGAKLALTARKKDELDHAVEHLAKKGIEATRLNSQGYGPEHPLETNATPEGRERNRRVEFVIVPCVGP